MIRATTPTHKFNLNTDINTLSKVLITYSQSGTVILNKDLDDCTVEGNTLSVTLTQEETNKFKANVNVQIQIRVKTTDGKSFPSRIYNVSVSDVLNDEVM